MLGAVFLSFVPFDSRVIEDKSVFGCVREGEEVVFSLSLPENYICFYMNLVLTPDAGLPAVYPMKPLKDNQHRYSTTLSLSQCGLYFYHFEYSTDYGFNKITKTSRSCGCLSSDGGEWQLTVYSADFETPEKYKGGVMYQIFPDRFCFSGEKKENVPSDRVLRGDWGGVPEWRVYEGGFIPNNDYFCGDLKGITEKLPYLASLSVSVIYLNPIFEAHSNHRYDTADYMKIDPLLGKLDDFKALCDEAKKYSISVILDGVFSHTGADSVYFNIKNRYPSLGAYNSRESKYYKWYKFKSYPNDYYCWWNVKILPETDEENEDFVDFICGADGVVSFWMRAGASGFRLDVADELPDNFIDRVRLAIKRENPEGYLLGEVWEDASNKISYGARRRYLLGEQFDAVMNYPFSEAIVDFVKNADAENFMESIMNIVENYPKPVLDSVMNHLGTHDTARIITVLSGVDLTNRSREYQSALRLNVEQLARAKKLLKLAATIQYTLPGIPSVYYGDEAGLQGGYDPFNRACYPWGQVDSELLGFYRELGRLRAEYRCFAEGIFQPLSAAMGCAAYLRRGDNESIVIIANNNYHNIEYVLGEEYSQAEPLLNAEKNNLTVTIAGSTAAMLIYRHIKQE